MMRAGAFALVALFIFSAVNGAPSCCRAQAPPQGQPPEEAPTGIEEPRPADQPPPGAEPPAVPGEVRRDIFGRPIFTDVVRSDYLSRAFTFWPQFDLDAAEGFHITGYIKEEYSSNLNLTDQNTLDDFITTVAPGFRYLKRDGAAGVDLLYLLGFNFYARNSDFNYLSHFGTLNSFYSLNTRWTLRLRDFLVRTDDPLEYDPFGPVDQYFLSTASERSPHLRNIAEPQIEYRYGPEDYISLLYRNMYYTNELTETSNGTENTINPRLMHWFNIHNGVLLDYSYTIADLNSSPNWSGNDARARYIYRTGPVTSFFVEYYFANRDFDPPSVSYRIHSPSVGAEHAFSQSFGGALQLGYYVKDPDIGDSESSFAANINLRKRTELTTYNLALRWGFREEYLTPDNFGFIEYRRAEINILRAMSPRLNVTFGGYVEKADYETPRRDWIYGGCAVLSWNVYKWLAVTPGISYRARDSNTDPNDYRDYRGILRIAVNY